MCVCVGRGGAGPEGGVTRHHIFKDWVTPRSCDIWLVGVGVVGGMTLKSEVKAPKQCAAAPLSTETPLSLRLSESSANEESAVFHGRQLSAAKHFQPYSFSFLILSREIFSSQHLVTFQTNLSLITHLLPQQLNIAETNPSRNVGLGSNERTSPTTRQGSVLSWRPVSMKWSKSATSYF